ncbi:MAG TPA: hypothetical protein VF158_12655 [Longimicrobiales bacterium]
MPMQRLTLFWLAAVLGAFAAGCREQNAREELRDAQADIAEERRELREEIADERRDVQEELRRLPPEERRRLMQEMRREMPGDMRHHAPDTMPDTMAADTGTGAR